MKTVDKETQMRYTTEALYGSTNDLAKYRKLTEDLVMIGLPLLAQGAARVAEGIQDAQKFYLEQLNELMGREEN